MPKTVHQLGKTRLLSTGRLGRPLLGTTPEILVDSSGQLCCMHGEHMHHICKCKTLKNKAVDSDHLTSGCDCTTRAGLGTRHDIPAHERPQALTRVQLYEFLHSDPERHARRMHGGMEQVHAVTFFGAKATGRMSEIWIRCDGSLVCPHGACFHKLKRCLRRRRSGASVRGDCGCTPSILGRHGSVFCSADRLACSSS